jgi:hypothetical protein
LQKQVKKTEGILGVNSNRKKQCSWNHNLSC